MFRLNPELDRQALKAIFRTTGRVQIRNLLDPLNAERLYHALRTREDWRLIINSGDKVFDPDRETRAGMSPEQVATFESAVFASARDGFQYRYGAIRVPDEEEARLASGDILARFATWMSGGEMRDFLRDVTEAPLDFADAQATAYGPGDFLTCHDDDVEGKKRHAAYVFGLTPRWRVEWGGLLLFHGADGNIDHGLTPGFNMLNIFAVPQPHSVSFVNRAAAGRRYSITGWLRSR